MGSTAKTQTRRRSEHRKLSDGALGLLVGLTFGPIVLADVPDAAGSEAELAELVAELRGAGFKIKSTPAPDSSGRLYWRPLRQAEVDG
jgi:hypothetical protein